MITEEHHTMPCPTDEICDLCNKNMDMIWMTYGSGEETRIGWKCGCGGTHTTEEKECKMSATDGGDLKLCKNCKYVDKIWQMNCTLKPLGLDLVSGKHRYESASLQRSYWNIVIWRCGKKGRFWEQRDWKSELEIRQENLRQTIAELERTRK